MTERGEATGPKSPVRTLTVDFWNTLFVVPLQSRPRFHRDCQAVWARELRRLGTPRSLALRRAASLDGWATQQEYHGRAPSLARQADWLESNFGSRPFVSRIGAGLDRVTLTTALRRVTGAGDGLRRVKAAGWRLVLLSNVVHQRPRAIRTLLRRSRLLPLFDGLIFSSDYSYSKPDPRIYRHALSVTAGRPQDAVHVGDMVLDVAGARAAGMAGIRVRADARAVRLHTGSKPRWAVVPGWKAIRPELLDRLIGTMVRNAGKRFPNTGESESRIAGRYTSRQVS